MISFGHGDDTDGSVDFYIGWYKWAFELTREGDRLTEHVDRFVKVCQNAKYYQLIPIVKRALLQTHTEGNRHALSH